MQDVTESRIHEGDPPLRGPGDILRLVDTAKFLQKRDVAGIYLNSGCPAPIVCSKNSGRGLLRNPDELDPNRLRIANRVF